MPILSLAHIPLSRVLARCCRWGLHVFCGIRPVGVIRLCWICPIATISPSKNKNPTIFATFLRLGTLFCSPKAEIGCRTADYLRFCIEIRDRGSPRQSPIAKKLQSEPFFCFRYSPQRVQGGVGGLRGPSPTLQDGSGAAQVRRCGMMLEAATLRANAYHSNRKPSLSARLGLIFVFVCASLVQPVNVCRAHLALC